MYIPTWWLRGKFGSFATTGGLLPRCRHAFPPQSHFFNVGDKIFLAGKKFSMQANIIQKSNNYLYIAMKTLYDPSGRFSGLKNELDCEWMRQCAHNQDEPHSVVESSLKLTTHLHRFMHISICYQLHSQLHCSLIWREGVPGAHSASVAASNAVQYS
jgi:hypothetical protein